MNVIDTAKIIAARTRFRERPPGAPSTVIARNGTPSKHAVRRVQSARRSPRRDPRSRLRTNVTGGEERADKPVCGLHELRNRCCSLSDHLHRRAARQDDVRVARHVDAWQALRGVGRRRKRVHYSRGHRHHDRSCALSCSSTSCARRDRRGPLPRWSRLGSERRST